MDKSICDFDDFEIDGSNYNYKIKNFNSIDLTEIKEYLLGLPEIYFTYLKVVEGTKIEKVLWDYYLEEDLYDLILLLNNREMIFDMPYSYDVVSSKVDTQLLDYEFKVFGNTIGELSPQARERLRKKLDDQYSENNNKFVYLKAIKRTYINTVRRTIAEIIETQKEMYSIVEE